MIITIDNYIYIYIDTVYLRSQSIDYHLYTTTGGLASALGKPAGRHVLARVYSIIPVYLVQCGLSISGR